MTPEPPSATSPPSAPSRLGALALALFSLALLLAKVRAAWCYRVDSDEPQHLHVVWGWSHGLLQYRDLFDNHAPLFQLLCAPLFRALGERADIIHPMRLAMIPLYAVCLWAIYRLGTILYSRRCGAWATVFASLIPVSFWTSSEFRTDDLWATLWLLSLVVLLSGPVTPRRACAFGLVLGATFGVSLKTSLLTAALALAAIAVWAMPSRTAGPPGSWRERACTVLSFLGGLVLIPAGLLLFFAAAGIVPDAYYCLVTHSMVAGLMMPDPLRRFGFWLLLGQPAFVVLAFVMLRFAPEQRLGAGRALLFLTVTFYFTLLINYWPDITAEDFLPIAPLCGLPIAALLFESRLPGKRLEPWRAVAGVLLILLEARAVSRVSSLRHDRTAPQIQGIGDVLTLTAPGDFVMDAKGDSIFRPRPYRYVLETFTLRRMGLGLLPADIPARLVATRTALVYANAAHHHEWPRNFIAEHYLPLRGPNGPLLVPGVMLKTTPCATIEVVIPGSYVLMAEHGITDGTVDGLPVHAPFELGKGLHQFTPAASAAPVALYWAKAAEAGYSPFHDRSPWP